MHSRPRSSLQHGQLWSFEHLSHHSLLCQQRYALQSQTPLTANLLNSISGQISGFGTDVFGTLPLNWVNRGYYSRVGSSIYRIQAATRAFDDACGSTGAFAQPIGDRIVLNPSTINQTLPATEKMAAASRWSRGACIKGMGRHWEYDLQTAPIQSYNSSNLLPVVPMYDPASGNLNAIFFASTDVQQGLIDSHQWGTRAMLLCSNLANRFFFCRHYSYPWCFDVQELLWKLPMAYIGNVEYHARLVWFH